MQIGYSLKTYSRPFSSSAILLCRKLRTLRQTFCSFPKVLYNKFHSLLRGAPLIINIINFFIQSLFYQRYSTPKTPKFQIIQSTKEIHISQKTLLFSVRQYFRSRNFLQPKICPTNIFIKGVPTTFKRFRNRSCRKTKLRQ